MFEPDTQIPNEAISDEAPARHYDSVWVIEAPGKIAHFRSILESLGYTPEIVATRGHFIKMPDSLETTGIDASMNEHEREADPVIVEKLNAAIMGMPDECQVFIATDADQEGDVIAVDVYDTIKNIAPTPLRIRLRGMDKESVRDAISEAVPIDRRDAIPGRTRAIIDRLIGAGFARKGIAAGRVRSAILGVVSKQSLSKYKYTLMAPSNEGTRPWSVSTKIEAPITLEIANRLCALTFPALTEERKEFVVEKPDDMGRIMVKAGDQLGISPSDAARAMQAAYESGRLSYPRSDSRGLSEESASKLSSSFRKSGQTFQKQFVPIKVISDVHDSPYPIGDFNINHDPEALGAPEGIRVLIGRGLAKTGQSRKVFYHAKGVISAFLRREGFSQEIADYVDNLPWTRDMGPPMPGDEKRQGVVARRPDTVILEACVEAGLGRPSTYAKHISSFMDQGLVTADIQLTDKGQAILAKTPDLLKNPFMSSSIEKACSIKLPDVAGQEPWQTLAQTIVSKLPSELSSVMKDALEEAKPKPEVAPDMSVDATQEVKRSAGEPQMLGPS